MKLIEITSSTGWGKNIVLNGKASVRTLLVRADLDPAHYEKYGYKIKVDKQPATFDTEVTERNTHIFLLC